jgi:hypothetical protein
VGAAVEEPRAVRSGCGVGGFSGVGILGGCGVPLVRRGFTRPLTALTSIANQLVEVLLSAEFLVELLQESEASRREINLSMLL